LTAETKALGSTVHGDRSASMGPPFFDGGNKLQWLKRKPLATQLQWGRRFLTAETHVRLPYAVDVLNASMGPPFFDGGNL